jgi:hypothetical protein
MLLKHHDVEDTKKRDFILETLHKELRDVVIEARKVFDRFNMLGSCVDVIGTLEKIDKAKPKNGEEIKISIPFKLLGMHEDLENNFDWIVPKNTFDESSEPKSVGKGSSKTYWIRYNSLLKRLLILILMLLHLKILDSYFLRLAERR